MKKIKYLIIILIFVFLSSCTEKLEVTPTSYQDLNELITTSEGLECLQNGAYAYARRTYTRYFIHFAELIADTGEIIFVGSFQEFRDLQGKSMVSTFSFAESSWEDAYTAINNCNLILENLNVVDDPDIQVQLEANARFIRGMLYFDLTRFFALPYGSGAMNNLAIPLQTNGVSSTEEITAPLKATVGDIFNSVESDLLFAYNNLPADENFYASKYSVAAILSRFYLTTEDYSAAAAYADSVISSGLFELSPTILAAFNHEKNTMEDVFAWYQTTLDNEGEFNTGIAPFYASTNEVGRSEMTINPDFLATVYDITDTRGMVQDGVNMASKINQLYYIGFGSNSSGETFCAKWLSHKLNINMVRLAEMYLTRAEANQMLINNSQAIVGTNTPTDDIKIIRKRAGIDTTGTSTVTFEDIKMERYKELIFEGHRLHDCKRWKSTIWGIPYDDPSLIVPIPKKEIDSNPNLK